MFKVVAVNAVERASTDGTSSERSCCCLKWSECALWSVRVQNRGRLWSSEVISVFKVLGHAGSPACIKEHLMVPESTDLQFRFHFF